jgi:hypothetical protein
MTEDIVPGLRSAENSSQPLGRAFGPPPYTRHKAGRKRELRGEPLRIICGQEREIGIRREGITPWYRLPFILESIRTITLFNP